MLRIGIVAGEVSGDLLGAGLIRAIKARYPDARIEGIAGEEMIKAGCDALYSSERLAVMGFVEVLGRYRELVGIRNSLARRFIQDPPDLFIGIDAPDFNLGLEERLKQHGIKTVHYVSPSVWAWRQKRIKKIARAVDLMLTLFPFEAAFYEQHRVPVTFVGHPLADMIPMESDQTAARRALALPADRPLVALLPGSRVSEVRAIGAILLQTAAWLHRQQPDIGFVVPLITGATQEAFAELRQQLGEELPLTVIDGRSREVMAAADVVVLASGTATLEAMLLKRPMVVTYRMAKLTYQITKRLLKIPYVSLPNLLAGRKLVAELLQDEAIPENIGAEALKYLVAPEQAEQLKAEFARIHESIRKDASETAADAVLGLLDMKNRGRVDGNREAEAV